MDAQIVFNLIKQLLNDNSFAQAYHADPDATLRSAGFTDPVMVAELKQLIALAVAGAVATNKQQAEMMEWMENQRRTTGETGDAFKAGLRNTLEQIARGYDATALMYKAVFYLGFGLIITSVIFAAYSGETLFSLVFAGMGAADFLLFFLAKPPQDLQKSRADLAQLQIALCNWFLDNYNWNSYLIGLQGQPPEKTLQYMKEVSLQQMKCVEKTMALIEDFCETPVSAPRQRPQIPHAE